MPAELVVAPEAELDIAEPAPGVASGPVFPYCGNMDVRLDNPDLQAKIARWVAETGRGPAELVEDAMAGYFEELAKARALLNSRYDDLKSGRVKPIDGEEAFTRLKAKTDAQRNRPA